MQVSFTTVALRVCGTTGTMRTLIVLIAAFGVLTNARPHRPKPLSCNDQSNGISVAALHLINDNHHHGYKFQLIKTRSSNVVQKGESNCEFQLELDLEETKCHVLNPKPLDKCEVRATEETKVHAECNVTLTVTQGKAKLKTYACTSAPASAEQLVAMCPDCPTLLPLDDPQGLDSINQALKKFHQESNDTSFFKLLEVSRLSTQYMFLGQSFFAEFAVEETNCSRGVEPANEGTCQHPCDRNSRHGFCSSTVLGNGEVSVDCEIYDMQNMTDEGHHGDHHDHHHRHHHHHHGGPAGKGCGHHDHPGHHTRPAVSSSRPHPAFTQSLHHCPSLTKEIHQICLPPPSHGHTEGPPASDA